MDTQENTYPFTYDDAPRFHQMVICFEGSDWRDANTKPLFGVLSSQNGFHRVKMEIKPGERLMRPGHSLYDHKVVASHPYWPEEDQIKAQADDKAAFRFRPATKAECAGKRFDYPKAPLFAEDQPAVLLGPTPPYAALVENLYPFNYDDAPRFHQMVICFEDIDWHDGKTKPLFGVLDSQWGHPRIKMELRRGEAPDRPAHRLFLHKVVCSYSFWAEEDKRRAQADDKAAFHFRPASKVECAGKRFAYLAETPLFAEDHPQVLQSTAP